MLSGGGTAGGAWMLGLVSALRADGVDLGDADLIVGTSAGARAGVQVASGRLDEVVAMYRHGEFPQIKVHAQLAGFTAAVAPIRAAAVDRADFVRRVAGLGPLGPALTSAADRRREIAAQLPVREWPSTRLVVTTVDAESGQRVTFEVGSGVALHRIVADRASAAAIGPNDARTVLAALDAGAAQASREIGALKKAWQHSPGL